MQFFCRAVFSFFDKTKKIFLQRLPRQFRDGLVSEHGHQISFAQPLVFLYGTFLTGFLFDVQPFFQVVAKGFELSILGKNQEKVVTKKETKE